MNEIIFLPNHIDVIRLFAILCITLSAVMNDLKNFKISNRLIITGLSVALLLCVDSILSGHGCLIYIEGGILCFILFFLCYLLHAIGAGDAKLLIVIGLIAGIPMIFTIFMYLIIFTIMACTVTLIRNKSNSITKKCLGSVFPECHIFHFSIVILLSEIGYILQFIALNVIGKGAGI